MKTADTTAWRDASDEDLVEAVKSSDDSAFQELMRRYLPQVLNFVRQYARAPEDAEDIAQDAFFKSWKYIGRFKRGRTFRPWLFTIARNTALDHIKKKRASSFSELDDNENDLTFADTLHDTEPLAPEIFARAQSAEELTAVMETLHPDHRAVLVMHYHDDMTFDEIAVVMDKPMNTVKSWHRRALIRIRGLLPHQEL